MQVNGDMRNIEKIMNNNNNIDMKDSMSRRDISDKFFNILNNIIPERKSASTIENEKTKLSQEQLMLFARALQIQMNSYLYNEILNNALEANSLAVKIVQNYTDLINASVGSEKKEKPLLKENNYPNGDKHLEKIIIEAAEKYEVDADLIRSVILTESNFNPSATSPKGAMGLMQLMPATASDLGVKNAYDPFENIMGGTKYLKMLLDRYDGQTDLALAAYNWGIGNLERKHDKLPLETLSYIDKVNKNLKSMKG